MPTYYLYPKAISLDEITFKKTDVEIVLNLHSLIL